MADPAPDNPQDTAEAQAPPPAENQSADAAGEDAPKASSRKPVLFMVLCAAVALVAGSAGYVVAVLTTGRTPLAPASAQAGEPETPADTEAEAAVPPPKPDDEDEAYLYKDLESITVNLDEPRLARYVHAAITLAIPEEDFPAAAPCIDANMRLLRDWLTVYLTGLTLDEVRGAANLNRIRREILDAFNTELWPDSKPMIRKVLFKEFAVK
ncbi:MAG: flagellar basal body-associated FliL family protein [Planctomycetota bacterium]|nr:flagellar basal body-associated FliL family protein [Planctomycetota bacterium]